ncbi:complement decay-accelerating factor isoform X11 [Peromyscus leucopus]|uniref:complement decay-accelerating factor isoform X11 n=1 Tax=Peromyscus leucopus TaxID=10041 RepID=UPI001884C6B6|nr:complement decay-accelerating factor isoform X11 [Peromyscus leucopus]
MGRARAPGTRSPPPPPRVPPPLLLLLSSSLLLLSPTVQGDCGPPPEMPNATPEVDGKTSFPEHSNVVYSCNKGFQKIPDKEHTVLCLENGQWSTIETFCNKSCDAPTRVSFASLKKEYNNLNYFPIGTTVEYECRPGFQRQPSLSGISTCLENLEWSKVEEICKKKVCPNPGEIKNGHITVVTDISFGSEIRFSCDTGYRLVGSTSSFCSLSGKTVAWSDEFPECIEKSKVPSTSPKPTTVNVPVTQRVPATKTTTRHPPGTSKDKERSTSDGNRLIYGLVAGTIVIDSILILKTSWILFKPDRSSDYREQKRDVSV